MINPVIIIGGIVLLLACVILYLLIAEIGKQQQTYKPSPHLISAAKKPVNKSRFSNVGSQVIFIKQQAPQKKVSPVIPPSITSRQTPSDPKVSSPSVRQPQPSQFVSAKAETKLHRLLNGDRAAATRLVGAIRARNPDKPEQWCWEKAAFDLERDRH